MLGGGGYPNLANPQRGGGGHPNSANPWWWCPDFACKNRKPWSISTSQYEWANTSFLSGAGIIFTF